MKKYFIKLVSALVTHVHMPEKIRDLFIWPLASRVLGRDYDALFKLKTGFTLGAYLDDQLGRLALFYGPQQRYFWEPSTTQLLEKLIPNAHDIIVAGSHIGLTVLYARDAMKTTASTVHTFEPISHLFDLSQKNFELNNALGNIVLNKKALGDVSGKVTMTQDRIRSRILVAGKNPKNLSTEDVPVITIDSYCAEHSVDRLDLVFLDIEGYEYNALRGMETLLKNSPPQDIIYEISFPYKDNLEATKQIESYLGQFGYRFYIIEDEYDPTYYQKAQPDIKLTLATPVAYQAHQKLRYFNMYATLRDSEAVSNIAKIYN